MKRIFTWLMMVFMVMTLLPKSVFATEIIASGDCSETASSVKWELDSDGVLTISGTGSMKNSYSPWSTYQSDIKSVRILSGVTTIGKDAFNNCASLTHVSIPNTVTSIGATVWSNYTHSFQNCTSLTTISVDEKNSVFKSIDGALFSRSGTTLVCCPPGKSGEYVIPDSVTALGPDAFWTCRKLSNIIIPSGVTSIGDNAFAGCRGLTCIKLPDSVTRMGINAFSNCISLKDAALSKRLTAISQRAFSNCTSLEHVVIPDSVTAIHDYAFEKCSNLTGVSMPDSVISIGESAFEACGRLAEITIPNSVTSIGDSAFKSCGSLAEITIPNSVTSIGASAFSLCKSLSDMILPDSIETIEKKTFYGCESLTNVSIPNSVHQIEVSAFSNCSALQNVTLPNHLTSIEEYVFNECRKLDNLTLPDEITCIKGHAFAECRSLSGVTIPHGVTYISSSAFEDCTGLKSLILPVSITSIQKAAFHDCSSLEDVYYAGTKDDWSAVFVGEDNEPLLNAFFHFKTGDSEDPAPSFARPDVLDSAKLYMSVTPELVLEYTALAKLGYSNLDSACIATSGMKQEQNDGGKIYLAPDSKAYSVRDEVRNGKHCESTNSAQDKIWSNSTATYTEFYSDLIGDYNIVAVMNRNRNSGMYALCLRDSNGNCVISYRGSEGLHGDQIKKYLIDDSSVSHDDWTSTDFKFALESELSPQFDDALEFYNDVLRLYCGGDPSRITLTGHSLGGALAAYVSMITNARAYSIDGAVGHVIDLALYYGWVSAPHFSGTDHFNFINLTDEEKQLAANAIQTELTGYYPMNEYRSDQILHTTEQPLYFLTLAGTHHAMSYITYHEDTQSFTLNELVKQYTTRSDFNLLLRTLRTPFSSHLGRIALGTSDADELSLICPLADNGTENVLLSGTGNDLIIGSFQNDFIAAGDGSSDVYGLNGSDTYVIYRNNTGSVHITDPTGCDTILLCGWDKLPKVKIKQQDDQTLSIRVEDLNQQILVSTSRDKKAGAISLRYCSGPHESATILTDNIFTAKRSSAASSSGATAMNAVVSSAIRLRDVNEARICDESGAQLFVYQRGDAPAVNEFGQFYTTDDGIIAFMFSTDCRLVFSTETAAAADRYLLDAEGCITSIESYAFDGKTAYATQEGLWIKNELLEPQATTAPVQEVQLNKPAMSLQAGMEATLQAIVTPENADNHAVHWQTSDDSVVTVSEQGVLHAEKPGKARIRAITDNGAFALCDVTVTGDLSVLQASLSQNKYVYCGIPCTPDVFIDGLTRDLDFEVSYTDNIEIGSAEAVITGIGAYSGALRLAFEIKDPYAPEPTHPAPTTPITPTSPEPVNPTPVSPTPAAPDDPTPVSPKPTTPADPTPASPKPTTKPDDTKPSPKPDDTKPIRNPFVDVNSGDYFYDPVLWALTHEPQITDGMTETTFAPGETCTRGQVVTFLWRAMGCTEPTKTDNPFTDVAGGDYFFKAVLWAVEKGITDGTSATTFSPNDPCTRAHVVTFLHRAEGSPAAGSKNPFTDVMRGEYFTDAVLWAVSKGITDGTSATTFSPADPCTRGQIVTFLYRNSSK